MIKSLELYEEYITINNRNRCNIEPIPRYSNTLSDELYDILKALLTYALDSKNIQMSMQCYLESKSFGINMSSSLSEGTPLHKHKWPVPTFQAS